MQQNGAERIERVAGFYWIRWHGRWMVARWSADPAGWWSIDHQRYHDVALQEVGLLLSVDTSLSAAQ